MTGAQRRRLEQRKRKQTDTSIQVHTAHTNDKRTVVRVAAVRWVVDAALGGSVRTWYAQEAAAELFAHTHAAAVSATCAHRDTG